MVSKLSPSMMCVDFANMEETLRQFSQSQIEYLHVDIMDGHFVPNITLGVDFCKRLRSLSDIPLDIHLMVEKPEAMIDWFDFRPGELVSIHYESTCHIQRILAGLRDKGVKPMVALNPATPIGELEYLTNDLSGVLVMTVNPGFAGQQMVPATLRKIRELRAWLDEHDCQEVSIEIDGNVSFENAVLMRKAGADLFVGGSSSIFSKEAAIPENIARMRAALQDDCLSERS